MHVLAGASTRSCGAASSLPSLSPSSRTSHRGNAVRCCSHHLPAHQPQGSTSRETTLWENLCIGRREEKPARVVSSCIHPLQGKSGCMEQGMY